MENSVYKISWQLVENWLRNPRNSIILVDEFNVNLTIAMEIDNCDKNRLWIHEYQIYTEYINKSNSQQTKHLYNIYTMLVQSLNAGLTFSTHLRHSPIEGFTFTLAMVNDFSVNSQQIVLKFSKHYSRVMRRLHWKYYWKILYSLKVSQFNINKCGQVAICKPISFVSEYHYVSNEFSLTWSCG